MDQSTTGRSVDKIKYYILSITKDVPDTMYVITQIEKHSSLMNIFKSGMPSDDDQ